MNTNYLKEIGVADIDLLINDIDLILKGYELHYIIDPSDVFEFSFPYGITFDNTDKSIDCVGDETIAYSYMFNNYKPILLDEYKNELFTKMYKISSKKMDDTILEKFQNDYKESNESKREELLSKLKKSATFLLSTALRTKSSIKILHNTVFSVLQIDSFTYKNKNDEIVISQIFKEIRQSSWSKEVFKDWLAKKIENSKEQIGDNLQKTFINYQSTYLDFRIIDRICCINKGVQESTKLKRKHIFLYFSSAHKSKTIFEEKKVIEHLPTIENIKEYNLLRNTKHAFLLFLVGATNYLQATDSKDRIKEIKKTKETLIYLKGIAKQHNELLNTITQIGEGFKELEKYIEINKKKRNSLETESITSQIQKHVEYKEKLQNLIKEFDENNQFNFIKILIEKLIKDAERVHSNIAASEIKMAYSIQSSILNNLLTISNENNMVNFNKGDDCIRGNYHHLPVLLFFNNHKTDNSISILTHIVYNEKRQQENKKQFYENLQIFYIKTENENEGFNYEGILLRLLIYLILSKKETDNEFLDVYEFLKNVYKNLLQTTNNIQDSWNADYLYFLAWMERREKKYSKSLKRCRDGIGLFPEDPRFTHGMALAYYNLSIGCVSLGVQNFDNFTRMISKAENSLCMYDNWLKKNIHNENYKFLVIGNKKALYNLILYSMCLYYYDQLANEKLYRIGVLEKKYSLQYLRDDLLIEKLFDGNQDDKIYPEFTHTESILELVEAISYYNEKANQNAINKIKEALKAVELSIVQSPTSILYSKSKEVIMEWKEIITKQ